MRYLVKRPRMNTGVSLFDQDFFDDFFSTPFFKNDAKVMRTDVREEDGNYLMEIDVPGFKKEEISVSLEDGYLKVVAKKEETNESQEKNYIRRERHFGSCARSFYVGDLAEDEIVAKFEDGILHLTFPKESKKEEVKKQIIIK